MRISFPEIRDLYVSKVKAVKLDAAVIEAYDALISEYNTLYGETGGHVAVLDRRAKMGVRVLQAQALLSGRDVIDYEDCTVGQFIFGTVHRERHENAFTKAYEKVIGNRHKRGKMAKNLNRVKRMVRGMQRAVKNDLPKMSKDEKQKLFRDLEIAHKGIEQFKQKPGDFPELEKQVIDLLPTVEEMKDKVLKALA